MATQTRTSRHAWPVRQRRDGQVSVRAHAFLAQDPLTGKQKTLWRTFTADSAAEAQADAAAWSAKQVDLFKKGAWQAPCKAPLAVWGRRWLERQRDRVKRTTWTGYSSVFQRYVEAPTDAALPRIGPIPMAKLQPAHVRTLYDYLCATPNRQGQINRGRANTLHGVLRQMLRDAFNDGDTADDLVARLRRVLPRPTRRPKRPKALTGEQLMAFLAAADADPYRLFWYLFVTTGARPGELLALRWPAVDLAAHTIHITETLHRVPKVPETERWEFTEAKTENADRVVEFPAELVPLVVQHRAAQITALKKRKSIGRYADLVFTTRRGQPVDWINMTKQYVRICRRAKLGTFTEPLPKPAGRPGPAKQPTFTPLLSPYHLRHTNATLMRDDGVPIDVISARLGHYKASFTADTYIGKRAGGQQVATAAWSRRLRKTGTK